MLVVTYSYEHNHPWLTSRNHYSTNKPVKPETVASAKPELEEKFADLEDESSLMASDEFSWFGDMEMTSSTVLESPIFAKRSSGDTNVAMFFPMREEDESLYADLGELSECSVVFGGVGPRLEICVSEPTLTRPIPPVCRAPWKIDYVHTPEQFPTFL